MDTPRSRQRSRSDLVLSSVNWTSLSSSNPPVLSMGTLPGLPLGTTEVMDDFITPGFASFVKRGLIVNNPMSYTYEKYEWATSNLHQVQTLPVPSPNATTNDYNGHNGANMDRYVINDPNFRRLVDVNILDASKLAQLAAIEARKRVSPLHVQSLVSLVELPKTVKLIADSVNTLRRLRRHVVSGNFDKAIAVFGTKRRPQVSRSTWLKQSVENRWLEFRYGWTPLVFEVQGVIKALSPDREFKTRGTARATVKDSANKVSYAFRDASWYGRYNLRFVSQETIEVRAYCLYTADLKFQSARDFGLTELPLAAWELVPFSFVVDWFVNVGDWLEALTPKLGVKILAEGYVIRRECVNDRYVDSWTKQTVSGNSYDSSGSFFGSKDRLICRYRKRVPNLDVIFNPPPFNVRLSTKRVLDAIALFGRGR